MKIEIHIHNHTSEEETECLCAGGEILDALEVIVEQGKEILAILNAPLGKMARDLKPLADSLENAVKSQHPQGE